MFVLNYSGAMDLSVAYKQQLTTILVKTKTYFRNNLELLPVFAFQILLIGSGGLLFFNQIALAESFSLMAYFLLVLGVLLNLIKFKEGPTFE